MPEPRAIPPLSVAAVDRQQPSLERQDTCKCTCDLSNQPRATALLAPGSRDISHVDLRQDYNLMLFMLRMHTNSTSQYSDTDNKQQSGGSQARLHL